MLSHHNDFTITDVKFFNCGDMELSLNDVQSLVGIYVIVEAIDKNHHSGSLVVTYKII